MEAAKAKAPLVLILALACSPAFATISGRVVGIADGDTLTVLDDKHQQHKIRLAEIDAPEKKQPFGSRSRQSLADICFQKLASVVEQGRDKYGRTIGRITCAGVDANAEQVRRGMAWVYDRYVTDRSLYRLQDDAKRERRGLWADRDPVPPWRWRRANK